MKTITAEFVDELIDFAPNEADKAKGFAHFQREGTVALYNMLAQNRCAYLADEVGMGKTYVALAVMSLLRYFNPVARVVVIAPRENIQRKWEKELRNFVRVNWRIVGNRVKALQGGPVWEPVQCDSLIEFANEAMLNRDRDFFLRMTSFSLALADPERRKKLKKALNQQIPWMRKVKISARSREGFRDGFGMAINGAVPDADLVIVDEGHNLKHGFSAKGSIRNRVMGLAFGHPETPETPPSWYGPRAKRVLFLSATPFEEDYGAIYRQLDVFGFGGVSLRDASGKNPLKVKLLADPEVSDERKRQVLQRLLLRRVSGLMINNELHTKNMYRREWRQGGMSRHDEPVTVDDPKRRLILGLMQKKVAEVLQNEKFNNRFQIGMLSSFESFLQTVETARRKGTQSREDEEDESSAFDDQEQNRLANDEERRGIDTAAVGEVAESYRQRFGTALPHPKLDAVAESLEGVFDTGDKTLVFVRRVATVSELAAKLDEAFDRWVRDKIMQALPELKNEFEALYERYQSERMRRPEELGRGEAVDYEQEDDEDEEGVDETRSVLIEEDEGGAESFFAWFFRGQGPSQVLSGAAFQKNRLSSPSSAYVTLFDDDYVAWLLGASRDDVIGKLAAALKIPAEQCIEQLRGYAFGYFLDRSAQRDRYPRAYVVEGYQVAALMLLASQGGELAVRAEVVLEERFAGARPESQTPPAGFSAPTEGLGLTTVCTELARKPELRAELWPEDETGDFREGFRRREQRRELLSTMARLGAAYIDLYLLAVKNLGSFLLGKEAEGERPAEQLAIEFVALLEAQREQAGFHAFRELEAAAQAFDHIIAVNFPEVPGAELPDIARIYAATLQKQVPVGRMSGGVNKRLVRQFRMPGYPLVLVSTDVLQEGEDLHTFCRRVVHYGISWTSSAMEQRTGRVDRIGGLVQRELDGSAESPDPEALIQVYYPHLRDTVEVLQVRRVLKRLNRFLELMHQTDRVDETRESSIDATRAWLEELEHVPPLTGRLESAFPVRVEWLEGRLRGRDVERPDWESQFSHFDSIWRELLRKGVVKEIAEKDQRVRIGVLPTDQVEGEVTGHDQQFWLELRSQIAGEKTLLRCSSEAEFVDMTDDQVIDQLFEQQKALGRVKICIRPRVTKGLDEILVEGDILFDPESTNTLEVAQLIDRTAGRAVKLKNGQSMSSRCSTRRGSVGALESMIADLVARHKLHWELDGRNLLVELYPEARRQKVVLSQNDDNYLFSSIVVGADTVQQSSKRRRDLAYRTWRRNALKSVVTFSFDRRDRLMGSIEQPVSTLHENELRFYIETLARECDRYEYILTGADRG